MHHASMDVSISQQQCIIVMRHGERLDFAKGQGRQFDPPLTEGGRIDAYQTASRYREKGIKKVISSPLLRCLQTAQEACNALDIHGVIIDNAICETRNHIYELRELPSLPVHDLTPYNIKVVNHFVFPIPDFPEELSAASKRFQEAIPRIADQYFPENILIVTHGYGVYEAIKLANESLFKTYVDSSYCGHVALTRTSKSQTWKVEFKFNVE